MGNTVCAYCNGARVSGPVHINRGDQPHEWVECMPCRFCDGLGYWSPEKQRAIEAGQAVRRERIDRGISLAEAAKALGTTAADLSAFERGKLPPAQTTG